MHKRKHENYDVEQQMKALISMLLLSHELIFRSSDKLCVKIAMQNV